MKLNEDCDPVIPVERVETWFKNKRHRFCKEITQACVGSDVGRRAVRFLFIKLFFTYLCLKFFIYC